MKPQWEGKRTDSNLTRFSRSPDVTKASSISSIVQRSNALHLSSSTGSVPQVAASAPMSWLDNRVFRTPWSILVLSPKLLCDHDPSGNESWSACHSFLTSSILGQSHDVTGGFCWQPANANAAPIKAAPNLTLRRIGLLMGPQPFAFPVCKNRPFPTKGDRLRASGKARFAPASDLTSFRAPGQRMTGLPAC